MTFPIREAMSISGIDPPMACLVMAWVCSGPPISDIRSANSSRIVEMPSNFVEMVSVEVGIDAFMAVHPRIKRPCPASNSIRQNNCISSNIAFPTLNPTSVPSLIKNGLCLMGLLSAPPSRPHATPMREKGG